MSIYSSAGQMSYTLGQLNQMSSGTPNSLTEGVLQAYNFIPLAMVQESQISIWPNPVISQLYLKMDFAPLEAIPYQIFDVYGRLQTQQEFTKENTSIPMLHFAAGTYILRLNFPNQVPVSFKLIKL
jgi:hypothetical protein